jgi:integrase
MLGFTTEDSIRGVLKRARDGAATSTAASSSANKGSLFRKIQTHDMRYSRVNHLRDAGMPVAEISKWMGHSDEKTTHIYLREMNVEITQAGEWHAKDAKRGPNPVALTEKAAA